MARAARAGARERIEQRFDVNAFRLIACVQAAAAHFRANRAGGLAFARRLHLRRGRLSHKSRVTLNRPAV